MRKEKCFEIDEGIYVAMYRIEGRKEEREKKGNRRNEGSRVGVREEGVTRKGLRSKPSVALSRQLGGDS